MTTVAKSATTLRVAAVQMDSRHGDIVANLEHAAYLCEQAAGQGAQLALLPELMPGGHQLTPALWRTGEPRGGQSERWLAATARRLGLYLGTSYLEVEGEDFYNTFALAGPDGAIAGRVRKQTPAMAETFFFRAGPSRHVIEAPFGRVGVGICNDNHTRYLLHTLQAEGVDLHLMPHAWCLPARASRAVNEKDILHQRSLLLGLAPTYARLLGVPAVLVNRCGPCGGPTPPGLVAKLLPPPSDYVYPGLSTIADAGGEVLAQLAGDEDFVVAEVHLDPARRAAVPRLPEGTRPYASTAGKFIVSIDEALGRFRYARSAERKQRAAAVQGA